MVFGQSRSKFFVSVKILGLAQFETIIVPPCTNGGGVNYRTSNEAVEGLPNVKLHDFC